MLEWFFGWFDKMVSSVALQSMMNQLDWCDWFTILFLIMGIIYGIQNGLIAEVAEIFEIIIVTFITLEYYGKVREFLYSTLKGIPQESLKSVSYILVGFTVWLAIGLTVRFFKKRMHAKTAQPLRSIGGALLGCVHLLIIWSFISQAIILLPYPQINNVYNKGNSVTGWYLARLSPSIHEIIRKPIETFIEEDE